ncbi:MAG: hypothetical protein HY648_08715 [Acidobacteria bacterium]|nr:hypothetical protein [Acidobacteriota bacterium]
MKDRCLLTQLAILLFFGVGLASAQDLVLQNGKIITVNDHGFTSQLGTVAQAMYVKDGKIVQVGANDQIRAVAGANASVLDLKGRTVIPGILLTHEHPFDWNNVEPGPLNAVLTDDVIIARFLEGSPAENLKAFPGVLSEALRKAKPGQWIYIVFTFGRNYQYSFRGNAVPYARASLAVLM